MAEGAGRLSPRTGAAKTHCLGHQLQNWHGYWELPSSPGQSRTSEEQQTLIFHSLALTFHSLAHLEGHVPHLVDGVRQIVVVLQEIEGAEPQQFKGDAHVAVVVKPVKHPDAETARKMIIQDRSASVLFFCSPCIPLQTGILPKIYLQLNSVTQNQAPSPIPSLQPCEGDACPSTLTPRPLTSCSQDPSH